MDINLNPQVGSVGKIATGPVKPREATPAADDVVLDESRALEARFSDAPEIRPDVVARARALPGVHAVITMEDMERALGRVRMPLSASPTKATAAITPYILSGTEVAFVGEAIAMAIASASGTAAPVS
jgi:carbon-monoxide dehydrogenase large subunit